MPTLRTPGTEREPMTLQDQAPIRRQALKTAVTVLCCSCLGTGATTASQAKTVDQITDPGATAANNMFRFEPDYLALSTGDEQSFVNGRSDHTVHSVAELWPEGEPLVKIAHKKEVTVRFTREGFYGFRCKRHGQYGMVMLVVVGKPGSAKDLLPIVEEMKAKPKERAGFVRLIGRYEQSSVTNLVPVIHSCLAIGALSAAILASQWTDMVGSV